MTIGLYSAHSVTDLADDYIITDITEDDMRSFDNTYCATASLFVDIRDTCRH